LLTQLWATRDKQLFNEHANLAVHKFPCYSNSIPTLPATFTHTWVSRKTETKQSIALAIHRKGLY